MFFFVFYVLNNFPSELPWDKPSLGCKEFLAWKENEYTLITPWSKLDTLTLSFVRKILMPVPEKRLSLEKILEQKWCHHLNNISTTGLWLEYLIIFIKSVLLFYFYFGEFVLFLIQNFLKVY